jgi:hypothetical protein
MSRLGMDVAIRFNNYQLDQNEWAFFLHLLVMSQGTNIRWKFNQHSFSKGALSRKQINTGAN